MANLTDRYYKTSNRKYIFEPTPDGGNFLVSIYKQSGENNYVFDSHLSPAAFTELMNEPDMRIDDLVGFLFDDDKNDIKSNSNLNARLHEEGIPFIADGRVSYDSELNARRTIRFASEDDAKKCVKFMENTFIGVLI